MTTATRVTIYVDGFNLYYGLLKANPAWKWLDLRALGRTLRPAHAVSVRYFTAKVRPVPDAQARERQRIYLKALETLYPTVTVHFGKFSTNDVRMALVAPPPGGPNTALVWKTEEKGSDVNIATYLLLDGHAGLYDEAIRQANARFGRVHVLNPRDVHSDLAEVAASYGPLDPSLPPACQLPNTVQLPTGRSVTRPAVYR